VIVPVLTSICNASFSAGRLPQLQKQAIVTARLKKPTLDPDDLNSYRPISNLSFVSKFVERAVAGHLVQHCKEHHLLPAKQSAYRRFHSTETAVLVVYNDIVCAVDSGQLEQLVLLDLSSAFPTVDHDCLLTILRNRFTVEGQAMNWFQSYLSERTQMFTAADSHSNSIAVNCSVPQGSVLGPIQFISYMEDVTELFSRHSLNFCLFADDTQLYTCAAPCREAIARQKLSTCTDDQVACCAYRRLKLNASKTELIWFGSRTALSKMATNRSVTVGSVDK